MTENAADLERIADELESGADLSPEQRRAIAAALRQVTLPVARNAERDRLLIECRTMFYPSPSHSDHNAAHAMATEWRRYAAAGWLRERSCDTYPTRHIGTIREALWSIMRVWPRVLSRERIRKIIGSV